MRKRRLPGFFSPFPFPAELAPFRFILCSPLFFLEPFRGSSFTSAMAAPWPSEFGSSDSIASGKSFPAWRKARSYLNLKPKSSRKRKKTL